MVDAGFFPPLPLYSCSILGGHFGWQARKKIALDGVISWKKERRDFSPVEFAHRTITRDEQPERCTGEDSSEIYTLERRKRRNKPLEVGARDFQSSFPIDRVKAVTKYIANWTIDKQPPCSAKYAQSSCKWSTVCGTKAGRVE